MLYKVCTGLKLTFFTSVGLQQLVGYPVPLIRSDFPDAKKKCATPALAYMHTVVFVKIGYKRAEEQRRAEQNGPSDL